MKRDSCGALRAFKECAGGPLGHHANAHVRCEGDKTADACSARTPVRHHVHASTSCQDLPIFVYRGQSSEEMLFAM